MRAISQIVAVNANYVHTDLNQYLKEQKAEI